MACTVKFPGGSDMSVGCRFCWVADPRVGIMFFMSRRRTERGVLVGHASPERATWRLPHDADGWRRDRLANERAQGGSIGARKDKRIGRLDRRCDRATPNPPPAVTRPGPCGLGRRERRRVGRLVAKSHDDGLESLDQVHVNVGL
ncbi:hypothetical protein PR202_ga02862 [Eleusine coracana subsp. coracana]|uniref:Uncharacterized protein n=1 Tax=Eleusine coracana subsp. coracana TaxID=191504 RepID=A0AAV5BLY8_ELECO|nr:hypothetical protein PR202_ga02862 [Eleusine coracana subsp. coracana]